MQKNRFFTEEDKEMVNQMLKGILLYKINNCRIIEFEGFNYNEIVETLTSRINYPNEIPYDEYIFSYIISGKYPKNLKIVLPEFNVFDAFFFFYQYDSDYNYKLNNFFSGISKFGDINYIAQNIVPEQYKNDEFKKKI